MAIRLLNKNEIATARSNDRSKEIAEGLKISRRVDSLRDLMSKEELALNKFRDESLAAITKEIKEATVTRDEILSEVTKLRAEKAKGLKEVEQGLLSITSFRETLDHREINLNELAQEIERKENELALSLQSATDEVERMRNHTQEAKNSQLAALEDRNIATRTLIDAQKMEDTALLLKKNIEMSLSLREGNVVQREQDAALREKENDEAAKELSIKELQLKDREKTLERSINRLQNNGKRI